MMDVRCCRCGHTASLPPHSLAGYSAGGPPSGVIRVGKSHSTALGAIARRLRCSQCGGREVEWGPMNRD